MFNKKISQGEDEQNGERLITNEPNESYERVFDSPNVNNIKVTENERANMSDNFLEQKKIDIEDSDIHHMPDKFLRPEKSVGQKKNIFIILGISLLIIVILAVGAFAFFALRKEEDPKNNVVLNLDENVAPNDQTEKVDSNVPDLTTVEGRDSKRISDILEIKSALSFYYNDVGKYPYNLSSLEKYLSEMPSNPQPGGEDYYYEVEDSADVYILTFVLESGGSFGNLILKNGKYELSSNFGISPYIEPELEPDVDIESELEPDVDIESEPDSGLLPIPKTGDDDDNDGLTNTEELLFGTKFGLPDSDFDGYLDGEELVALYDPLNDGGKLADNVEAVRIYNNKVFNYSVLYPAKWLVEEKSVDFEETVFYYDENDDFFKIQVDDNPQNLTIQKWYSYFSPNVDINNLGYFENNNVIGVKTKDGLNIYIAQADKVYIISYILVNTAELNYAQTFEMFSNSFKIIKS